MTLASRLYYGVVAVLPYVVLLVGVFSTFLGGFGLYQHLAVPGRDIGLVNAGLPLAFGLFLTWRGFVTVRKERRGGDPEG